MMADQDEQTYEQWLKVNPAPNFAALIARHGSYEAIPPLVRYHRMEDEFNDKFKAVIDETKAVFEEGNYVAVFGWLQWVFRRQACPPQFPQQIDVALRIGHAAYRLVDRTTIVPVGSDAELATLKRAFADVGATGFQGARAHLRNAAEELTGGLPYRR